MSIDDGLIICSAIGFCISLYFTLVYYNAIQSNQWFIPPVCRMDEGTCRMIIQTPDARIFKAPNFVLGLLYYAAIILYASVSSVQQVPYVHEILSAISCGTVFLGVYLSYSLLVKLKTSCVLCFSNHLLNLILTILLFYK